MEGEPDTVAKTIALALCGIARADRRDAALIRFAGPGHVELTALPKGATGVVDTAKALAATAPAITAPQDSVVASVESTSTMVAMGSLM